MTPELVEKYDARVPRYTSYPTANHFVPEVGPDTYRKWLAAVAPTETLSLYLHVPFCTKLCWYCGCHTTIVSEYDPVIRYRYLLLREIDLVTDAMSARHAVSHVYWGGGTPTILKPSDFADICGRLRDRFHVSSNTKMSVEIDPRGFTREMAAALARAGTTRASLGVQDFDPEVQTAINRVQPYEVTAQTVDWLRAEGIEDINIDLIYGLPRQTVRSIAATVERTLSLAPTQVALFGYAHVPWMKRHQRLLDEYALPDTRARWTLYWAASEQLAGHSMIPVGLDHFAAPDSALARAAALGGIHRNFQGYTTDDAAVLLGFGVSAIGTLPQGYVQNAPKISHYREAIAGANLATVRGCVIGPDDRLRREVISALMCNLEVDIGMLCQAHGQASDYLDREIAALAPFLSDGIVAVMGRRLTLKEDARPLVRSVCAAFDAYYRPNTEPRHAKAV